MSRCVVAADVGNSAIKFAKPVARPPGTAEPSAAYHTARIPLGQLADAVVLQRAFEALLADAPTRAAAEPVEWRVASVHRAGLQRLLDWIGRGRSNDRQRVIHAADVPMPRDVRYPERVGVDRLVAAWEAQRCFGGAGPIVVVDAGSAVTVDWVDASGTFCGGAILPGLELQLASLAAGTDALPRLAAADLAQAAAAPGRDTSSAIAVGVAAAVAGGVQRLIDQYADRHRSPIGRIVLTGGDADWLSVRLTAPHEVCPNLVLHGLLHLP